MVIKFFVSHRKNNLWIAGDPKFGSKHLMFFEVVMITMTKIVIRKSVKNHLKTNLNGMA